VIDETQKPKRKLGVAFCLIIFGPVAAALLGPVALMNPLNLPVPLLWAVATCSIGGAVSSGAIGGWLLGRIGGSKVAGILVAMLAAFFGLILWSIALYPILYFLAPSPNTP
jgi:hypothetical protein